MNSHDGILPCLSLPSKRHSENSISSIFLESPHQVDIKNAVKSSKHFFWLFQYSRNSQCNCSDKTGLNSFYTSQKRTWTVCYQRSEIFFQKLVWFWLRYMLCTRSVDFKRTCRYVSWINQKMNGKVQPTVLWYLWLTCFRSFFWKNWRHQKVISKWTDL